jgi:hypothetical protein
VRGDRGENYENAKNIQRKKKNVPRDSLILSAASASMIKKSLHVLPPPPSHPHRLHFLFKVWKT